jgi:hypothetical protein
MKSLTFFAVLFISITLIYLVLYKISEDDYQIQAEHFTVNSNSGKNTIVSRLGISENRIRNYKESGDSDDTNDFQIEFEIYPRNLSEKKQPSITELETTLQNMISNKDILKIQSGEGQNIYLGKIKVESINLNENGIKQKEKDDEKQKEKSKFVDPSIDYQLNYLKYLKSGIHNEISIQPRYKFNNMGKLELENIPTPTPTSTKTPTITSSPTKSKPAPVPQKKKSKFKKLVKKIFK